MDKIARGLGATVEFVPHDKPPDQWFLEAKKAHAEAERWKTTALGWKSVSENFDADKRFVAVASEKESLRLDRNYWQRRALLAERELRAKQIPLPKEVRP